MNDLENKSGDFLYRISKKELEKLGAEHLKKTVYFRVYIRNKVGVYGPELVLTKKEGEEEYYLLRGTFNKPCFRE